MRDASYASSEKAGMTLPSEEWLTGESGRGGVILGICSEEIEGFGFEITRCEVECAWLTV